MTELAKPAARVPPLDLDWMWLTGFIAAQAKEGVLR
jgi:hypothetical protein